MEWYILIGLCIMALIVLFIMGSILSSIGWLWNNPVKVIAIIGAVVAAIYYFKKKKADKNNIDVSTTEDVHS